MSGFWKRYIIIMLILFLVFNDKITPKSPKTKRSRNWQNGPISGSRNHLKNAISGYRNCKNGRALFLDPEIVKMVRFLDPEIVKMDQNISGSRNQHNGAISGSRNRQNGRKILSGIYLNVSHQRWSLSVFQF